MCKLDSRTGEEQGGEGVFGVDSFTPFCVFLYINEGQCLPGDVEPDLSENDKIRRTPLSSIRRSCRTVCRLWRLSVLWVFLSSKRDINYYLRLFLKYGSTYSFLPRWSKAKQWIWFAVSVVRGAGFFRKLVSGKAFCRKWCTRVGEDVGSFFIVNVERQRRGRGGVDACETRDSIRRPSADIWVQHAVNDSYLFHTEEQMIRWTSISISLFTLELTTQSKPKIL